MKHLVETVEMMCSPDYKQRFRAEYAQVVIRYEKLAKVVMDYECGRFDFQPKCSISLLSKQLAYMESYMTTLRVRAALENIDISDLEYDFD